MANVFDDAADSYDAVRPGYPGELFKDISRLTRLGQGARVLEVGCGTGQATLEFARRGYTVLCVEPGRSLLDLAKRKLIGFPVEFRASRFEDWPLEEGMFDLVASGTAWHWVDADIGFRKAAAALKPGGFIALFWNLHPTPYKGFFEDVQRIYRELVPEWRGPDARQTAGQRIDEIGRQISASNHFEEPAVKLYSWTRAYCSGDYVKLLDTYSDHRALPEDRRSRLYREIKQMIDEIYGGWVERPYLTALFLASRKESP